VPEALLMEDLTPVHEFSQTVDFYNFVFEGIEVEVVRLESHNWTVVQCLDSPPLELISTRINNYIAQHDNTKVEVKFFEEGSNSQTSLLVGCDPDGNFFSVYGPDFYNPRPY
jgi:hypothetical protein